MTVRLTVTPSGIRLCGVYPDACSPLILPRKLLLSKYRKSTEITGRRGEYSSNWSVCGLMASVSVPHTGLDPELTLAGVNRGADWLVFANVSHRRRILSGARESE